MIEAPSLPEFCAEMQRLASVIEAPAELLPSCTGPDVGGLRVNLSGDAGYVLSYSEKGDIDLLAQSADADLVMEQVFVQVTERMASEHVSADGPPIGAADLPALSALPPSALQARAEALHTRVGETQAYLLTQLNPDWGRRQLARNATRLTQIRTFFDGDRP